ncbi:alpha-hydroxy-acid oxidizing protein [Lipingzhangella rawalii]|uniref:alpha-hydroxy-acid oxidizing protein n=1 Tax=Lipingzhangella rawalii TaxID=2055835 RepID=UPI0038990447
MATWHGSATEWSTTLAIKGVHTVADVRAVVEVGSDAAVVSNAGACRLDRAVSPLAVFSDTAQRLSAIDATSRSWWWMPTGCRHPWVRISYPLVRRRATDG